MFRKCVLFAILLAAGVEVSSAQEDFLQVIVRSAHAVQIRPSSGSGSDLRGESRQATALDFNLPHGVSVPRFPPDVEAGLKELWAMPTE